MRGKLIIFDYSEFYFIGDLFSVILRFSALLFSFFPFSLSVILRISLMATSIQFLYAMLNDLCGVSKNNKMYLPIFF